jgi:hypothetical protein
MAAATCKSQTQRSDPGGCEERPQTITQRGVETAVVLSIEDWKRLEHQQPQTKKTLLEVLQSGPRFEIPLPPRHRRMTRKPVEF